MTKLLALAGLALLPYYDSVSAIELTPANWDKETNGKAVLIKFLAPWWGHCKSMKPDWDKLMGLYKDSKTALIADVDCTAGGKDLCQKNGVQGYPTIKWGMNANALKDYQGGRDFNSLKSFADKNLGPQCSIDSLSSCSPKEKKLYTELLAEYSLDPTINKNGKEGAEKSITDLEAKIKKERLKYEFEQPIYKGVVKHLRKLDREKKAEIRKKEREEAKAKAKEAQAKVEAEKIAKEAKEREEEEKEKKEEKEKADAMDAATKAVEGEGKARAKIEKENVAAALDSKGTTVEVDASGEIGSTDDAAEIEAAMRAVNGEADARPDNKNTKKEKKKKGGSKKEEL